MLDVISFLAGIAYGYLKHGKEEKKALLKKGALIGVALGAVLSLANLLTGGGVLLAAATAAGVVIAIVYLVAMFVVGVWIGDWLEAKLKKPAPPKG